MRDILFLAHRIPYPPDKGDKIRAWNILRHLASRHRVHLGMFIDAPEDAQHIEKLRSVCTSVFWRPLSPRRAKLRSLRGLLNGASLTQGYYNDPRFRADVDYAIEQHKPETFYVFCSAMAPYVANHQAEQVILDMVDVDSEKWRQYAEASTGLTRMVYARESRALLALERQAAATADAVTLVSPVEVKLFISRAPEAASYVHSIGNGVDVDYFDPSIRFDSPFDERPAIVFTGAMDYRPNVEAMTWFVQQVMPLLRRQPTTPCLWIVGAKPSNAVIDLAGPDVRVTGHVPDVRPYLSHAVVVVAPLHIARGLQNKVLEAMAMAAAVVVTPQIRQTLDRCHDDEVLTATEPAEFAGTIARIFYEGAAKIGGRAKARIICDYRWETSFEALDNLLDAGRRTRPGLRCSTRADACELA
jgi:polysaccharide biosynthesis protein PslH